MACDERAKQFSFLAFWGSGFRGNKARNSLLLVFLLVLAYGLCWLALDEQTHLSFEKRHLTMKRSVGGGKD